MFARPRQRQRGLVLIVLLALLLAGASFVLMRGIAAHAATANEDLQRTYRALNAAKEALIGYAVSYPCFTGADDPCDGWDEGPGYLPCPDRTGTGSPGGNCSWAGGTSIGWLPEKYLKLNQAPGGPGRRLWYAVSDNFRYGANKRVPLNSETPGQLSVDGSADVVAVVIAPGPELAGQDRTAFPNNVSQFLEGENATAADTLFTAVTNAGMNDRMIAITRQDLMTAVEQRVAAVAAGILDDYRNAFGHYPWLSPFVANPASFDSEMCTTEGRLPIDELQAALPQMPAWLKTDDWHLLVYAAYASPYAPDILPPDPPCPAPTLSITLRKQAPAPALPVDNQVPGVVLVAGPALPFQARPGNASAYFEDENDASATANAMFVRAPLSTAFNDQVKSLGAAP